MLAGCSWKIERHFCCLEEFAAPPFIGFYLLIDTVFFSKIMADPYSRNIYSDTDGGFPMDTHTPMYGNMLYNQGNQHDHPMDNHTPLYGNTLYHQENQGRLVCKVTIKFLFHETHFSLLCIYELFKHPGCLQWRIIGFDRSISGIKYYSDKSKKEAI